MLKSLHARNVALLVVVVLAGQILSFLLIWALAIRPQAERVGTIMARNIAAISATMDGLPPPERSKLIARINSGGAIQLVQGNVPPPEVAGIPTLLERIFIRSFAREMRRDDVIVWQEHSTGRMWVRVVLGGEPWWVTYQRPHGWSPNGALFASFCITVALALAGGILLQRRVARPLEAFADAADATKAATVPPPLATDGPEEIARVARSFNAMAARLAAQEADRTLMLAGISHDLRTPLAKLRLELALIPGIDPRTEAAMARHFERIDAMLTQFLDFARGIDGEPAAPVGLVELVEQLGFDVEIEGEAGIVIEAPPVALQRAIANLVRNAVLYGKPPIAVRISGDTTMVRIAVEDQGKGIDPDLLARVDQPFVRGDRARPSDGGTGLGLAIARHVAVRLGGSLALENREGGGFVAALLLPVSPPAVARD